MSTPSISLPLASDKWPQKYPNFVHPANAIAQCSGCKDTLILEWNYARKGWEEQRLAYYTRRTGELFHKCGASLKIWYINCPYQK